MGNYRQHLGFASVCGVAYAGASYVWLSIPWLYGTVAALLALLGGLLPDIDSETGAGMRSFTGVLGLLAAVVVWRNLDMVQPGLPFELHLWSIVATYATVRYGLRKAVGRLTVHRGMSHSIPTCFLWGALTYLHYPSPFHGVRLTMAVGVMVGFLSHLLLDEMCSVDLKGARLNKAFGTALKFWAPSPWSTLAVYGLLAYLASRVIEVWPEGVLPFADHVPAPMIPWPPDQLGFVDGRAAR